MQLQPQSEVTMSLTAIIFKPDGVVTIGRGAEGAGRLPQDWLQVSSKHCAIRYDADKVCSAVAVSMYLWSGPGLPRRLLDIAHPEHPNS